MTFTYDYGDNWKILIRLEKIIMDKALPGKELPRVLGGAGYGIVEDCGGTTGLKELSQAFKRGKGKLYQEYSQWLGVAEFDLVSFDIEDMEPTKRSMDILLRCYKHK